MTHFAVLVITDGTEDSIEGAVERLLAPYDENGVWFRENSKWDWWVIGGRWTGVLDGYDPDQDPRNLEPCEYCEATGTTTQAVADRYPAYQIHVGKTCIQCQGKGEHVKWVYEPHDGDIQPTRAVDRAKAAQTFAAMVTPDGEWHGGEFGWWGIQTKDSAETEDAWAAEVAAALDATPDGKAVVVDCHV